MTISEVPKGEFFKRKENSKKVYTRGDYDRSQKKYECHDEDDISRAIYLKGNTTVYIGFEY